MRPQHDMEQGGGGGFLAGTKGGGGEDFCPGGKQAFVGPFAPGPCGPSNGAWEFRAQAMQITGLPMPRAALPWLPAQTPVSAHGRCQTGWRSRAPCG